MGWKDWAKRIGETSADAVTFGTYSPIKERITGDRSSSATASFNPLVSLNRGDKSALKGAATGAGAGYMIGGLPGAGIGLLAGNFIGGRAGQAQAEADATRQAAMDQAIASQGGLQREMEARRQQDLERTMALYGPALQELERLYGVPMSAWGQAIPQNARAAMAPPRQGMLNGQPVNIANRRPEFQNLPVSSRPTPIQGLQKVGNLRPLFRSGG